jgi:DNA-binding NtrC family response regulator
LNLDLDSIIAEFVRSERKLEDAIREFESRYISLALEGTRGNRSLAARRLGIHRNTLINKLNRISQGVR